MCVIEKKTYVHTNGRTEVIETRRPCHRAVGNNLCPHVEQRNIDSARIVEVRPTNITRRPSIDTEGIVITSSPSGNKVYREVGYKKSKPNRVPRATNTTPTDSAPSSSPSLEPIYREVRPGSSRASPSSQVPQSRPQSTLFGETSRTERPDGTAVYPFPPSLRMSRADDPERPRASRPSSFSSTSADVDSAMDPEDTVPGIYRRRPSKVADISGMSSPSNLSASPPMSTPGLINIQGLSRFRSDSVNEPTSGMPPTLRPNKGKQPVRAGELSDAGIDRLHRIQLQEDARQAQVENARRIASEERQEARQRAEAKARLERQQERAKEQAAAEARERAEQNRRAAAAALEGDREAQKVAEQAAKDAEEKQRKTSKQKRLMEAELKQMARERAEAGERVSADNAAAVALTAITTPFGAANPAYPYDAPLVLNSPTSPGSSRTGGNRTSVVVHNPRDMQRRNSMRQRGDNVIRRSTRRPSFAQIEAEEAGALDQEDEFDADRDAGRRRNRGDRREERYWG